MKNKKAEKNIGMESPGNLKSLCKLTQTVQVIPVDNTNYYRLINDIICLFCLNTAIEKKNCEFDFLRDLPLVTKKKKANSNDSFEEVKHIKV